jgi:putative acetyltransferase
VIRQRLIRQFEADDLGQARELFREYAASVGAEICFQKFQQELAELPGGYAPPEGRLLLAYVEGQLAGCVALRRFAAQIGEIKRLYVRPAFRGTGLGRELAEQLIGEARRAGYKLLRLDSLPRMERAIAMYRSLGFCEIARYGDNPDGAVCFETQL